ncbi:MAG TPA: hypothetical protein VEF04_06685, partial [Blastocatellia bacterium]|nr:hypothetical protein [Blastocatellia bacterium]
MTAPQRFVLMLHYQSLLYTLLLIAICALSISAQQPENTERKVQDPIGTAEEERRAQRKVTSTGLAITPQIAASAEQLLDISADKE